MSYRNGMIRRSWNSGWSQQLVCLLFLVTTVLACGAEAPEPAQPSAAADPVGNWRAVLESPGGELPFRLEIERDADGELQAVAHNGEEASPFSSVTLEGSQLVLATDWYDSEITAQIDDSGQAMAGTWRKTQPTGNSTLAFRAQLDDTRRFLPLAESGLESGASSLPGVAGTWAVTFTDDSGSEPARAEWQQQGNQVTGTFLTPTGDYRFLEGQYEEGLLRLSTFDGAHAFLFQARAQEDGSLTGDFWSRDTYHATFVAVPAEEEAEILPDSWELVGLTNSEGRFSFSFPDLDGQILGLDDPRFAGRVVLVNIFGSWCPNCNDEAPLLASWDRRFRDQGLSIVGLAYELTGDPERDRQQVRRFAERHEIDYPLLLAGLSDKSEAAATLPDLSSVVAYPTSVFIGRDGRVRKIHSGFAGPGTGRHHEELVAELEQVLNTLLTESPPA